MKVKFSRCNSNNLTNVPIVDGQLIYVKDTKKVYMDVGNERNDISDFYNKSATDNLLNAKVNKSSFVYDSNTETLSITIS